VERVLVIGATGQLGTAAIEQLQCRHYEIRALVRSVDAAEQFRASGVDAVLGDLTDPASLTRACQDISVIVATATAAMPTRKTDTFHSVDLLGYENLIRIAREANVRRFIYTSVLLAESTHLSPLLQCKRKIEEVLVQSGLEYVIFRADIFMDVAFTMMGSTVPIQGTRAATALRDYPFAKRYFSKVKDSIQDKHLALIPGDGKSVHALVCVADVASFPASAVTCPTGIYAVGGPQQLTFLDVVRLYETILQKPLRVRRTPAAVFRIALTALRPFSPAGSNLMCLNYISATEDTSADKDAAEKFGVTLTPAETFLRQKASAAAFG
jgi:uncharacterized protein YbjT (DUF2867 family)